MFHDYPLYHCPVRITATCQHSGQETDDAQGSISDVDDQSFVTGFLARMASFGMLWPNRQPGANQVQ